MMEISRNQYLDWMMEQGGRVRYNLASGAMPALSTEQLGIRLEDIPLQGFHRNGYPELLERLASRWQLPMARIVLVSGATAGMHLVLMALVDPGDEVVLEVPSYETLYRLTSLMRAEVIRLPRPFEKGFQLDMERLERRIGRRTKAVLMSNLHNPSGVATDPEKLRAVGQIARSYGAAVVCSEVYLDHVFEGRPPQPAHTIDESMISVGSLSKLYGMQDVRVGWVICREELAEKIRTLQEQLMSLHCLPAQALATAALQRLDQLQERNNRILAQNLALVRRFIEAHGDTLQWVEPDGGPVCFPRLSSAIDSWQLAKQLLDVYDTLIVPGDFFWAKGHIRIGYSRSKEVVVAGLENLASALEELKRGAR